MEKQYWDIKRKNFDQIIFFKKGKFYELYEQDADIGHREFDLKVTDRINMRMAGFPEASFNSFCAKFIAKGYKVGRVEQVETVSEKSKRLRETGGKVIKGKNSCVVRELRQVVTAGTLVDQEIMSGHSSNFLLCVKEDPIEHLYGFVFVECSTGKFTVGLINDDVHGTAFETLIHAINPSEVVFEKGNLSKLSLNILKTIHPQMTSRKALTEFWEAQNTIDQVDLKGYFKTTENNEGKWPDALSKYKDDKLVMSAFGGCVSYLRDLKLDEDLISMSNFNIYQAHETPSFLILDGQTLQNLEVLKNNVDGSRKGTMIDLLDHCVTSFGKRMFQIWICHPLKRIQDINDRFLAIEEISKNETFVEVLEKMKKLPDLERLLCRIHAGGRGLKEVNFGNADQKKMDLFLKTIQGFHKLNDIIELIQDFEFKSLILKRCSKDQFPKISEILEYFDSAFDHTLAKETGYITPAKGINQEYDTNLSTEKEIEKKLDDILKQVQKSLKTKDITFVHKQKERFQLEIPISTKDIPKEFTLLGSTKKVKRYYTPQIIPLVKQLDELNEKRDNILREITKEMFRKFDDKYKIWTQCIQIISELDCIYSLYKVSQKNNMCCPKFYSPEKHQPFLELKDMVHPCITLSSISREVIPNDVNLGNDIAKLLIVTGPNMGGKSTLLRATCISIIMAQMGCYVPASKCELTPVDRIFTRIGANDRIMSGQSTFMVELYETSNILRNATKHSLVILDELGRGTSTFDGYAIAYSVIRYLAEKIKCRTLFSTHYYMLTEELLSHPNIDMFHMKCVIDNSISEVIFLYKFVKGVCQKSYGLNVARMAGISQDIVESAEESANNLEQINVSKNEKMKKSNELTNQQLEIYNKITTEKLSKEELKSLQKTLIESYYYNWDE